MDTLTVTRYVRPDGLDTTDCLSDDALGACGLLRIALNATGVDGNDVILIRSGEYRGELAI